MRIPPIAIVLAGALSEPAWAHGSGGSAGGLSWPELAPAMLLAATLGCYLDGLGGLRRAGSLRRLPRRRIVCFLTGWLVVALALLSPLHALAGQRFWAHMVEHELLMALAAPLFVAARPAGVLLRGAGVTAWRGLLAGPIGAGARRLRIAATRPLTAWSLHTIALWSWHLPPLFEAALRSELVHAAQHTTFLTAAIVYWSSLAGSRHGSASRGVAVFSLFATSMQCGLLGALLALDSRPLYPTYAHAAGLDPVLDQQLAGLVMWVPVSLVYGAAAVPLLLAWLREAEGRVRRWEAGL